MRKTRQTLGAVLAVMAAAGIAAGTARAQQPPEIKQNGQYVMSWKDDKLQLVAGLRYASVHFPSKWLMLQVGVMGMGNKPIQIDREDIALVVPGGTRINLATQKALQEEAADVRRYFQEASIVQDPIEGYFVGSERVQRLGFFAPPTTRITYEQVTVDRSTLALGYLFFRAPADTFAEGRYTLEIFNKEVDVKLPLYLPASKAPKLGKDKDGKTIPW